MRRKCRGHLAFFLILAAFEFGSHAWSGCVALGSIARSSSKIARQQAAKDLSPISLLPPNEVARINAAVRSKALEAIAVGNLPPGKELELISALDLGTIPWNQLPVQLKEKLSLPLEDRGIDSLSLNLSVAVQAKDYANGSTIPLSRLSTFHLLVEGKFSKLKGQVEEMIVATSEGSQLPKLWHLSGATHRTYDAEEFETWRKIAQEASLGEEKQSTTLKRDALKRWPHQKECLKQCRKFLQNSSTLAKRDFFVQMATGTGKSLVMADLLASISSPKRACVIVPKLDLMEQMAQLLVEMCPSSQICRVGTGWPADLTADIFVCVRNSAWQLANLTFDLVLFDEAHHYEPIPQMLETRGNATTTKGQANEAEPRTHTQQVLALNARRRFFFSATLRHNLPDFDFGLRPAIEAGVIQDYSVMVPVLSEGDPRPGLVKLIQNLPLSRKILAFCNTVHEAQAFTTMLIEAGIAADHYNGGTTSMRRRDILQSFERSEIHGGIRVLVTVDVLSEGVDLPVADTCLFVAPRRGVRLRQCVGRVLRKHHAKVDALVVAPPIVKSANDSLVEDAELVRLLRELATEDPLFEKILDVGDRMECRIGISTAGLFGHEQDGSVGPMAGEVLEVRVLPYVLDYCKARSAWDRSYQELVAYKGEHGHNMLIPTSYRTSAGFRLGQWVSVQRQAKKSNLLSCQQIDRLDMLGFVWNVPEFAWMMGFQRLSAYAEEQGHVLVPWTYQTPDGFKLGRWVSIHRFKKSKGRLSGEQIAKLDEYGFVWDAIQFARDSAFKHLQEYKLQHGHVLVPWTYQTPDGFKLGSWVNMQRVAKSKGRLSRDQIAKLDEYGFVWDAIQFARDSAFKHLQEYKLQHGHVLVPWTYQTPDGFKLGRWVSIQRFKKSKGRLSGEQIAKLDEYGFVWDAIQFARDSAFKHLQEYKLQHGHVLVPWTYQTPDGFKLGSWVNMQRVSKSRRRLSREQIAKLDEYGFVWDAIQFARDSAFKHLQEYKLQHGHVLVPRTYQTPDGFKLGNWVNMQRVAKSKGRLSREQIVKLDEYGFVWDAIQFARDSAFKHLQEYKSLHGHVLVPATYQTPDGFKLGSWVRKQRVAKSKERLSREQIARLDEYGFVWDAIQFARDSAFKHLQEYKLQHGHVLVPATYQTPDGFKLGNWVSKQRVAKSKGRLSREQIARLDEYGFVWDAIQFARDSAFKHLQEYKLQHGHVLVPRTYQTPDGFKLGNWVSKQRFAKSKGRLSREQMDRLDEYGFVWNASPVCKCDGSAVAEKN